MGLFYNVLIKEVLKEFENQKELDLESFLLKNENKIKKEYKLSELLLLLNFTEILRIKNTHSDSIEKRFKDLLENDLMF